MPFSACIQQRDRNYQRFELCKGSDTLEKFSFGSRFPK